MFIECKESPDALTWLRGWGKGADREEETDREKHAKARKQVCISGSDKRLFRDKDLSSTIPPSPS